MSEGTEKICLVCGVNMNKRARHDKYNYVHPTQRKRGKVPVSSQGSESDSDLGSDSDSSSGKSKRKNPKRKTPVAAASSGRQTRNQNPKAFASSLCKVLQLPATPDEPFLRIFSAADYCPDCMTKVKDIHDSQKELEKIQARLDEYKVDIELDLSKHLQKIPFCKNVLKNDAFSRYKEDINLILDYHDGDKNKEGSDDGQESKRLSALRLKRKSENGPQNRSREAKKQKVVYKEDSEEDDHEISKSKSAVRKGNSSIKKEEPVEDESPDTEESLPKKESSEVAQISSDSEGAAEKLVELNSSGSSPEVVEVEPSKPVELNIAKKEPIKRDPSLKCPICVIPRYFEYRENLEAHITGHKNRKVNRIYSCEFCSKEFDRPNRLQLHISKAHPNGEKDGGESDGSSAVSGWICGFCDEEFQRKKLMEEHLDAHPEAKPLNCHACGRGFKRLESLQKGFQIYKGQPVDPCKYCNRSIPLKDYLAHNQKVLTEK